MTEADQIRFQIRELLETINADWHRYDGDTLLAAERSALKASIIIRMKNDAPPLFEALNAAEEREQKI